MGVHLIDEGPDRRSRTHRADGGGGEDQEVAAGAAVAMAVSCGMAADRLCTMDHRPMFLSFLLPATRQRAEIIDAPAPGPGLFPQVRSAAQPALRRPRQLARTMATGPMGRDASPCRRAGLRGTPASR